MTDWPGWWVLLFRAGGAVLLIAAALVPENARDWCLALAYLCLLASWWRLYDLWAKANRGDREWPQ